MKKFLIVPILALVLSLQGCGQLNKLIQDQLTANTTRISGKATLSGASDNSGIIIKMGKQVSASTQSIIMTQSVSLNLVTVAQTGSDGNFAFDVTAGGATAKGLSIQAQDLSLDTGMYTVVFSKDGYESVTVDNVPVILGQSVYNMDAISLPMKEQIFEFTEATQGKDQFLLHIPEGSLYKLEICDDSVYGLEDEITLTNFFNNGNSGLSGNIGEMEKHYEKMFLNGQNIFFNNQYLATSNGGDIFISFQTKGDYKIKIKISKVD